MVASRPLEIRFWEKVVAGSPDECWRWKAKLSKAGYGRICVGRKLVMATWVALELAGRPRPDSSKFALHSCDNPACVNPAHLRWGTLADNAQDAISRGRHYLSGLTGGGKEKWKTRLAQQADARERARGVGCPKCGAKPNDRCIGKARRRDAIHLERLTAIGWPVSIVRSQDEAHAALLSAGAPCRGQVQ